MQPGYGPQPAPWEPRRPQPQGQFRPPQPQMPQPGQYQQPYPQGPQFGPPGFGPQPMYYPPQRPKRKVWLIVLLAVGIPILLLVGFVMLGVAMNATADETPASPSDRQLVMTAKEFEPFMEGFQAESQYETAIRREYIDSSWEVEYIYESDDFYMMSVYSHEANAEDASYTFSGQQIGTSIGYSGEDLDEIERNDLFRWGDESKFYLIKSGGNLIGNRLIARKGGKVVYIVFSGVYFDEAQWIHELFDPYLARISARK